MPKPAPPNDGMAATAAIAIDAVDIIIVNWNSGRQLQDCLSSVARWGDTLVRSVIVVDNGSTDGSAENLDAGGLTLVVIAAGENLGFGRACNLGAANARAPALLFLNPDAALGPGALRTAVDFLNSEAGSRIGAVGIKLRDGQNLVQCHTTVRPTCFNIFTHDQRVTRFDHLHSRRVHHVIGAFYLIRSRLFDDVGRFDERFFMYLEDLDLSDRVHAAGWGIQYLAEAEAFHRGGGTSDQVKAMRLFYSQRSRLQYSLKHFTIVGSAYVFFVTLAVEPLLRLMRGVRRASLVDVRETLAAYRHLLRAIPAIVRQRRRLGADTAR